MITQNVRGFPDDEVDNQKIKSLINQMKENKWNAACLQETWRLGDNEYKIGEHLVVTHGHKNKSNKKGRVKGGVCIILNPELAEAYKNSDQPKITTEAKGKFGGRFLGIPLHLPNFDDIQEKLKHDLIILISPVYHPVDNSECN